MFGPLCGASIAGSVFHVALDPHCCPADPEDLAENYVMDALDAPDLVAFEEHLLICEQCRDGVEDADMFVRAMRSAALRLLARTASDGD